MLATIRLRSAMTGVRSNGRDDPRMASKKMRGRRGTEKNRTTVSGGLSLEKCCVCVPAMARSEHDGMDRDRPMTAVHFAPNLSDAWGVVLSTLAGMPRMRRAPATYPASKRSCDEARKNHREEH